MSGIDGIGEAVTGGMLARAVEPPAGEAVHARGGTCLNCGTQLIGDYCHGCGQAGHVHRSLHAFFHDLLHGVFHFEGKIWHTLPMLMLRPGELTRRYIAGERARFVSPIALFLFTVFLMFAVFHAVGGPFSSHREGAGKQANNLEQMRAARQESADDLKQAEAKLAQLRAAGGSTTAIDKKIADLKENIFVQDQAYNVAKIAVKAGSGGTKSASDEGETHTNIVTPGSITTKWPRLNDAIEKANENPSLLAYKLQSNAYKFSWALIPISVPFVWLLLFWKREYGVYDHTIFVTYSIAFMSLGVVLLSLLRPLGLSATAAGLAIAFVPPIHMYKQLRGAYRLSRFSALWRTILLLWFAFMAGGFFFLLLLALGAMD